MKADFEWPIDLKPSRMSFWYRSNVSESRGIFTGQRRFLKRQGSRWIAEMEVTALGRATGRIDALLAQLEGPIKTVALPDFRRLQPTGANRTADQFASLAGTMDFTDGTRFSDGTGFTASGVPRIAFGAVAGSTSILTDGWHPNETALNAGDYVGIGGQMVMLTEDATADANGAATLRFRPALHADTPVHDGDPANPTALTREKVTVTMRLASRDEAENPTRAPVVTTWRLRFEEAL